MLIKTIGPCACAIKFTLFLNVSLILKYQHHLKKNTYDNIRLRIGIFRMKKVTVWSRTIITIFARNLDTLTSCCKRRFCLHKERLRWVHKRTNGVATVWEKSTGHRQLFDLLWQDWFCSFWMNEHTFYGILRTVGEIPDTKRYLAFS